MYTWNFGIHVALTRWPVWDYTFTTRYELNCHKDTLIDKDRQHQLESAILIRLPAYRTMNRFSEQFNNGSVMEACTDLLARHGVFGSQDRYSKGLASDWWINDDFFSVSRVLSIDILDARLQTYVVMEGLRNLLFNFSSDWMLMVGHDNAFDNRGQFVGKPGSYYFWIRKEIVEIYSEEPKRP